MVAATVLPSLTKSPRAQLHIWQDRSEALSPERSPSTAQPLLTSSPHQTQESARSLPPAAQGR